MLSQWYIPLVFSFYHLRKVNIASDAYWCIKSVDGANRFAGCNAKLVKNGHTRTGKQRYKCKDCGKISLVEYANNACLQGIDTDIIKLTKVATAKNPHPVISLLKTPFHLLKSPLCVKPISG